MSGRIIKNLVNEYQSAGYKDIQWDATNNEGKTVAAGMYITFVKIGTFTHSNKMILLK